MVTFLGSLGWGGSKEGEEEQEHWEEVPVQEEMYE
jgi:hypothetical protein